MSVSSQEDDGSTRCERKAGEQALLLQRRICAMKTKDQNRRNDGHYSESSGGIGVKQQSEIEDDSSNSRSTHDFPVSV